MFLPLPPPARPVLLAHFMPWYESRPVSGKWGWHWTMNRFDPEKVSGGRREAASRYRPTIGLYDSGDPDAIECQLLLMKMAGIDGVLVDWYGTVDLYDYGIIHRNTGRLLAQCERLGMKFGLVYEDQTVTQLVKNGKFRAEDAVPEGRKVMDWLGAHWFRSPAYLRQDGRPVLLVFGPQYYKPEDWPKMFAGLPKAPAFYTLHYRREGAFGAYDWPLPKEGDPARARFYAKRKETPESIPVAYPRFDDIYKEAGIGDSFPVIPDQGGATYRTTLKEALRSGARFVQIATWNDWGEGTGIEPTTEFGTRDLQMTQRLRGSKFTARDLQLPLRLYLARKRSPSDARLASISQLLVAGKTVAARKALDAIKR